MNYRELPSATETETEAYLQKAYEFLKTTNLYSSSLSTAKCAIADYLAAQDGKQLLRG